VSNPYRMRAAATILGPVMVAAACGGPPAGAGSGAGSTSPGQSGHAQLSGEIRIDGSSTVYPITEAVAEAFQKENPAVRVTVAFAGTGGGFKKFCAGETDANNASRPIKTEDSAEKSEATVCKEKNIDPVELTIAMDGLSVLVNPQNTFVDCLTTAELTKIWDQGSTVKTWADVRSGWPAEQIKLYGPGADSGTFDYFTEEINGEVDRSRSDYTQSEDDNQLVLGISGDKNALGYFGYAYYVENQDKLKLVPVNAGSGCVAPSEQTINDGTYTPLSRPLFVYPSKQSLERPEVQAFFKFFLQNVSAIAPEVGYIALPAEKLTQSQTDLTAAAQ
jgi:phosphate transport system substrate-binding protein